MFLVLAQNPPPNLAGGPTGSSGPVIAVLLVVGGVLAVLALLAIVAVVYLRRRRSRASDPTCGQCGYIVTGLTTFVCPECGSDLRQVGIVPAGSASPRSGRSIPGLLFRLGAVTLLVALVSWPISYGIATTLWPMRQSLSEQCTLTATAGGTGPLEYLSNSSRIYLGEGYAPRWTSQSASIALPDRQGARKFIIYFLPSPNGQYEKSDGSTVAVASLPTSSDIKAFFAANGIDAQRREIAAQADELAKFFSASAADPGLKASDWMGRLSQTFYAADGRAYGATAPTIEADGFLFLWLIPWAILMYWQVRRWRRSPMQSAAADEPAGGPARRTAATNRTLTVMFSDISGFTTITASAVRSMALSVARQHHDLVAPVAKAHGGTIIKSLGDGLLLTFDSATDAVLAGLEIQSAASRLSTGFRQDQSPSLEFRIGIATGEVVLADQDVFGDTVNLACRLQAAAKSGEVLFSHSTFATINRAEVRSEELGPQQFKGFTDPIPTYRAVPSSVSAPSTAG